MKRSLEKLRSRVESASWQPVVFGGKRTGPNLTRQEWLGCSQVECFFAWASELTKKFAILWLHVVYVRWDVCTRIHKQVTAGRAILPADPLPAGPAGLKTGCGQD